MGRIGVNEGSTERVEDVRWFAKPAFLSQRFKRGLPQQPQADESISPEFRISMVSPVYLLTNPTQMPFSRHKVLARRSQS